MNGHKKYYKGKNHLSKSYRMRNLEGLYLEFFIITKNKNEGKEGQKNLQRTVAWPGGAEEHRRNEVVFSHRKWWKR